MYDDCASKQQAQPSASMINYHMYGNKFRTDTNNIDIENELRGYNVSGTKCNSNKYNGKHHNKESHIPLKILFRPQLDWNTIKKH
jgi:hypothetical protein